MLDSGQVPEDQGLLNAGSIHQRGFFECRKLKYQGKIYCSFSWLPCSSAGCEEDGLHHDDIGLLRELERRLG